MLLLGFIVTKQYVFRKPEAAENVATREAVRGSSVSSDASEPKAKVNPLGKNVPVEGIDWKKNKQTLVFYMSNTCHFCTESGAFYQQLVKKNSENKIKFVAVLPQAVEDGKEYLKGLGVSINNVYSSSLASIGVTGTPTLLLVGEDGIVSEVWVGKLSDDKEEALITRLFN